MKSNSKVLNGIVPGTESNQSIGQAKELTSNLDVRGAPNRWQARPVAAAGIAGSVIASLCCLPAAAAVALGLGLGTVAGLSQLLEYQRFFQVGGLAFAGLTVWRMLRRRGGACSLSESHRQRLPLLVLGSFAVSFAVLNVLVIPLIERSS